MLIGGAALGLGNVVSGTTGTGLWVGEDPEAGAAAWASTWPSRWSRTA